MVCFVPNEEKRKRKNIAVLRELRKSLPGDLSFCLRVGAGTLFVCLTGESFLKNMKSYGVRNQKTGNPVSVESAFSLNMENK